MKIKETPIYVTHCVSLSDRKNRLDTEFQTLGLSPTWITNHDADNLTWEDWSKYYSFTNVFRPISPQELSLVIKHLSCYEQIVKNGQNFALILEDDVTFVDNFSELFDKYLSSVPDDFDLIFLGNCCNLRVPDPHPEVYLYAKSHPATKCTDSYIIKASAAEKLLKTMIPCHAPADHELNAQLEQHNMKVYWLEPPLISQGSETGLYKSSVR